MENIICQAEINTEYTRKVKLQLQPAARAS